MGRRSLRSFAALIGAITAGLFLIVTKLHFESFGRLSVLLDRSSVLRSIVSANPLIWCVLALAAFGGIITVEGQFATVSVMLALAAILCLVAFDYGLQLLTSFPKTLASVVEYGECGWTRLFMPCLRDKSQMALVQHSADIAIIVIALIALPVILPQSRYWLVLLPITIFWLRSNALWQEVVHISSHTKFLTPRNKCERRVARLGLTLLDRWCYWGTSQFFGMFPGWYDAEHIGIHHPEVNSQHDVESVVSLNRTSFIDFAYLTARLIANTTTGYGMYRYFWRRRVRAYFRMTVVGAVVHALTILVASIILPPLGVWLAISSLGFSYSVAVIALSDHGMTDPDCPTDIYRNSYNVVWQFDDYGQYGNKSHLSHHLKPAPCWGHRAMASALQDQEIGFGSRGAILFRGFAYPDDLFRAYWNDDPDFLYPYVVSVGAVRPTPDEWRRIFTHRSRPPDARKSGAFTRRISSLAARLATSHIPPSDGRAQISLGP